MDSIISRLMSELDRRTDAIKRLGQDLVKVREEKATLEVYKHVICKKL